MTLFTFPALGTQGNRFQTIEALQAEVRRAIAAAFAEIGEDIKLVGEWAASSGVFPTSPTPIAGSTWIVTDTGTVDGVAFIAGDKLSALGAGGVTYAGNWLRIPRADLPEPLPQSSGGTGAASLSLATVAPTGGTTARPLADQLPVMPEALGAVGNGVADDTAALVAAMTASRVVVLKPGATYRITGSGTNLISMPAAGCHLVGGLGSRILIDGPSTFYRAFDCTTGSLSAENVIFEISAAGMAGGAILRSGGNMGLNFRRCTFRGGVAFPGGVQNREAYAVQVSTDDAGWLFDDCTFTGFTFPLLKANSTTSAQRNLRFVNCTFDGNYREDLSFNSPNGIMDNVTVEGCTFRNNLGIAQGNDAIYLAFASVTNFTAKGNRFTGPIREAIHAEEGCRDFVISGNVGVCDFAENGAGVGLLENNQSGTLKAPSEGVIAGNSFRHTNATRTLRFGIHAVENSSDAVSAVNVRISDNVLEGFFVGAHVYNRYDNGVVAQGNTAVNCDIGFRGNGGGSTFFGNTSKECASGVGGVSGEEYYEHHFDNCVAVSTNPAGSYSIVLVNPRFSRPVFDHPGASATELIAICPLRSTDRLAGRAVFHARAQAVSTAYSVRATDVTWDGTTFSTANAVNRAPGTITTALSRGSDALRVDVFSTTARTNVKVTLALNGMISLAGA